MGDAPLSDDAPDTLELADPEGKRLHKPWAIPSGPQDWIGVELVCRGTVKEGCVDATTPDDNDPGELGVELELGLVEQRPKKRPSGPQGSIGEEGDGTGEGDDDWSFDKGAVTTGWDVAADSVSDGTFVALSGTDDCRITQTSSTMTAGGKQITGEGVGVFEAGG